MKRSLIFKFILIGVIGLTMGGCDDDDDGAAGGVENTVNTCFDEIDNDGDGLADCADGDCRLFAGCEAGEGDGGWVGPTGPGGGNGDEIALAACDDGEVPVNAPTGQPWAVGRSAPNFRAETYDGQVITLSCLLGRGPVVLELLSGFL